MVEESEIIGLFQELKRRLDKDREYLKYLETGPQVVKIHPEFKSFWEGLVEGRELTIFEICKYFEDIDRPELSKPCREIFGD